jgi:hypothetical protein
VRSAVEPSGGGEFSFGVASALFGVVEVGRGAGGGLVVGCAMWFEVGELSAEPVDARSELGVTCLFGCMGGACVGELGTCRPAEVGETVRDLTSRPQCVGWDGGGEFVAGAGGGVVGAVGGEDAFEDVDGVTLDTYGHVMPGQQAEDAAAAAVALINRPS